MRGPSPGTARGPAGRPEPPDPRAAAAAGRIRGPRAASTLQGLHTAIRVTLHAGTGTSESGSASGLAGGARARGDDRHYDASAAGPAGAALLPVQVRQWQLRRLPGGKAAADARIGAVRRMLDRSGYPRRLAECRRAVAHKATQNRDSRLENFPRRLGRGSRYEDKGLRRNRDDTARHWQVGCRDEGHPPFRRRAESAEIEKRC